jgi:hypothetical protein
VAETLGYHVVKTTFGTWLPGNARGYWFEAWSSDRGFHDAHRFHDEGDPTRGKQARRRMKCPVTTLTKGMAEIVAVTIGQCILNSSGGLKVMAAAIEPTHMHLLIPYSGRDIEITAKRLADQTTKAIHRQTTHDGPVWSKNNWIRHIFTSENWENALRYIDDHNIEAGRGSRPYPFLCDIEL